MHDDFWRRLKDSDASATSGKKNRRLRPIMTAPMEWKSDLVGVLCWRERHQSDPWSPLLMIHDHLGSGSRFTINSIHDYLHSRLLRSTTRCRPMGPINRWSMWKWLSPIIFSVTHSGRSDSFSVYGRLFGGNWDQRRRRCGLSSAWSHLHGRHGIRHGLLLSTNDFSGF